MTTTTATISTPEGGETTAPEEEFDFEDNQGETKPALEDAESPGLELGPNEGQPEAETEPAEQVEVNPVDIAAAWQSCSILVTLRLLPDDGSGTAGRPVQVGMQVDKEVQLIQTIRELDLGRLPFFLQQNLDQIKERMGRALVEKYGKAGSGSATSTKAPASSLQSDSGGKKDSPAPAAQLDLFEF